MSIRVGYPEKTDAIGETAGFLLRARGLAARTRHGGVELLSRVELKARAGRSLGIVGETGCGKSITCRAITGQLARHGIAASGSLEFDGTDLLSLSPREWQRLRGREIGFVPQSSLTSLDPVMRIGAQLRETVRLLNGPEKVDERVLDLLEKVRMPDPKTVMRRYPHELSGGMRQRVVIALGVAGNPRLLVADEPTTALDVTVQRRILELLESLCDEQEMALVLVTHDLAVVEETCDDIVVMYAGMTVESGPTSRVLGKPAHPYTRALLGARPSALKPGARLTGIAGTPPAAGEWTRGCRFRARCPMAFERCAGSLPELYPAPDEGHRGACFLRDQGSGK